MSRVALRMDDVGACSKQFEVYSKWSVGWGPIRISGNWLFLKYLEPFRAWGPYDELEAAQWEEICALLDKHRARLTVAITAAWAESEQVIVPFPERFPRQAEAIKRGIAAGLLEVANHGLTHCVVEGNRFRPRLFSGNRQYHREFWEWVPLSIHDSHLQRAQTILQTYFAVDIVTFVPPGNVFTEDTLRCASRYGLRYVSGAAPPGRSAGMVILGNEQVVPFHDRDVVLNGLAWLEGQLTGRRDEAFCFVRDLAPQPALA